MTPSIPEPLTPPGIDLQDFPFMPLDVIRLRDSDLAANESPEACWAAVQLWCASWHQIPAASVPDDDKWLAKHTGYGRVIKDWLKVRLGALRGWIKCTDGRLYHPVVAEKAREAWQAKLQQRWRTECARIKKHADRHEIKIPRPTFEEWMAADCPVGKPLPVPRDIDHCPDDVPGEPPSKGQGEGQRQGDSYSASNEAGGKPPAGDVDNWPKETLWATAKDVMAGGGTPRGQCFAIVTKLRDSHGDDIAMEAVRNMIKNSPLEPVPYLQSECLRLSGFKVRVPDRWWATHDGIIAMGKSKQLYFEVSPDPAAFMTFTAKVWLAAGEGAWINENDRTIHGIYRRLVASQAAEQAADLATEGVAN